MDRTCPIMMTSFFNNEVSWKDHCVKADFILYRFIGQNYNTKRGEKEDLQK